MKTWTVSIPVAASVTRTVEAETKEEAIEKAIALDSAPCLCHHCADDVDLGDLIDHEATATEDE